MLILRDIEGDRARRHARVDRVACPKDFTPEGGLSGDRETATAQAAAEFLRREGVTRAVGDRTLPLIFAEFASRAASPSPADLELGAVQRRRKDEQELAWLREAQATTEEVMARGLRADRPRRRPRRRRARARRPAAHCRAGAGADRSLADRPRLLQSPGNRGRRARRGPIATTSATASFARGSR